MSYLATAAVRTEILQLQTTVVFRKLHILLACVFQHVTVTDGEVIQRKPASSAVVKAVQYIQSSQIMCLVMGKSQICLCPSVRRRYCVKTDEHRMMPVHQHY